MNLTAILENALQAVAGAADIPALETIRVEFLGKKGSITELLKSLGAMDPEQRKQAGAEINELKQQVQDVCEITILTVEFFSTPLYFSSFL